jgi:hypothetical protein
VLSCWSTRGVARASRWDAQAHALKRGEGGTMACFRGGPTGLIVELGLNGIMHNKVDFMAMGKSNRVYVTT